MITPANTSTSQTGTSMIEVLVTLVILLVGLLGLAGLQMQAQRSEMESYQRVQALTLLEDMVGRINANREVASCYDTTSVSYLGANSSVSAAVPAPACAAGTAEQNALATQDMTEWSSLLYGAAESGNTGAMLGGRGCIFFDSATRSGTVIVVWQGLGDTHDPASLNCARGLYGGGTSEKKRRAISAPFTIGCLECT